MANITAFSGELSVIIGKKTQVIFTSYLWTDQGYASQSEYAGIFPWLRLEFH